MNTIRTASASALIAASLMLPAQVANAQTMMQEYQTLLGLIGRLTSAVAQVAAAAAATNNPGQAKQVTDALSDYVSTVSVILQDVVKKVGSGQTTSDVSRKEANELYTLQLKNLLGEIRSANPGDKDNIAKNVGAFAKGRRDFVMSMIYTDPDYVFSSVLSAEEYALLPTDAQMTTPKRAMLKGSFERVVVKEKGTSVNEYYVTDTGVRYRVHVKGDPAAQTGNTVSIDGALLEDDIATLVEKIVVTN